MTIELPAPQVTRRVVGQVIEIVTTAYEFVPLDEQPAEPPPQEPATGDYPAPPEYQATADTVALWDWNTTSINDAAESDPAQQVVSANNTTPAYEPAPTDPKNSPDCYTMIVPSAGGKVVEFGVNHGAVKRPQGTAARLFFPQWGFLTKLAGKTLVCDYALYFPDEFVTAQGEGVGLAAGVQNKNPDFSYGLNLVRHRESDPPRFTMFHLTKGVFKQLAPGEVAFRRWIPIRYETALAESGGWLKVYIDNTLTFSIDNFRSVVAGFGPTLYDVHAVNHKIRMLFSNMRIDAR